MLPVYKAISFQRVADKGGRTRPWVVLVDADKKLEPYVVKLFNSELIAEKDSVTNEVLGNVLAAEFGFNVPEAALIELDKHFQGTLHDLDLLEQLRRADGRLKFGSKLLDGYYRFDPSGVTLSEASRMMPLDSLLAFDNLIRNPDRNFAKPNLLVKSDEAFLIDHELGFEINAGSFEELLSWNWPERYSRYHIFFNYLKRSSLALKEKFFDEFGELLRYTEFSKLEPYIQQLRQNGYPVANWDTVAGYFSGIRQNWSRFVSVLKGRI